LIRPVIKLGLPSVSGDESLLSTGSIKTRVHGILVLTQIYRSLSISKIDISTPQLVSDDDFLDSYYSNISSLLHQLYLRNPPILKDIEFHLRSSIPGFDTFSFKTSFGAGKVMAFYKEIGSDSELALDALSEGTIRLLCWLLILLNPIKVPLVFDEPDLGLHPRTMELLASLIKKAAYKTQVIVTTHNPYFLSLFEPENIAVMKREPDNNIGYYPVENSKVLKALLEGDFGGVQELFLTGELDAFSYND